MQHELKAFGHGGQASVLCVQALGEACGSACRGVVLGCASARMLLAGVVCVRALGHELELDSGQRATTNKKLGRPWWKRASCRWGAACVLKKQRKHGNLAGDQSDGGGTVRHASNQRQRR